MALWLLITVALVIFIGFSFSNDLSIGSYTLTKARFPEVLLEKMEEIVIPEEPPADNIPLPVETILEPDTTVHSLLIFGDSMTHLLSMSIARYGTMNNYKVTGVTWESSSIHAWNNSDKIQKYIEEAKPDFIIVSLGSNEMELKYFDRRIPDIEAIIKKIGDIPYVWVGPPLWKEDRGVYPMLGKGVPKEKLFRITDIGLIEKGPDHVHPTRKGADQWADTLMRWIRKSDHPILTVPPDSGISTKGHRFIYLHPYD